MENLRKIGRLCFAVSIAFFGVQYILYGRFEGGLPIVPPWTPAPPVSAYLLGAVLIVCGLSIAAIWHARYSAISLGTLLLLSFLFLHSLHASAVLHNGTDRTRAFEGLTLSSVAFNFAGLLPKDDKTSGPSTGANSLLLLGRFLFAISMIVFGAQHFMYAAYIAALIPVWIPFHLSWVYFTGTGFIAAGLCIATGIRAPLASMALGAMFLLWFLLLHAPRCRKSAQRRRMDQRLRSPGHRRRLLHARLRLLKIQPVGFRHRAVAQGGVRGALRLFRSASPHPLCKLQIEKNKAGR